MAWGTRLPALPEAEPTPLPAAREYEGGHRTASRPHQSLFRARCLRAAAPCRRGEGPKAPSFGAAGAHVRAASAWRTPRPLCSHSAVGYIMPCPSLRLQVLPPPLPPPLPLPPPPSAGSSVSTETSLPFPHAALFDWLQLSSVLVAEPMTTLRYWAS